MSGGAARIRGIHRGPIVPACGFSMPIALRAATVAIAYFAAALAGGEISRAADPAIALWPAGGILLAALVRTNIGTWPLTVAGCAAAAFAAATMLGESTLLSLGLAAINVAEVLVAVVLLRRIFDTPIALATLGEGAAFLVAAVALGPAAGAVLAAGLHGAVEGAGLWQVWQAWFGSHAIGMLVVAPALITWTPQYLADFRTPRRAIEAAFFVAALAAVTFLVFGGRVAPGGFIALMLWAAFRFGTFGCAATALAVVSFLLGSHTLGMGPISLFLSELPIEGRLLFVKLAMGNVVLTPMAVAVVVAERRRAADEIRSLNDNLEERVRERVAAYERSQDALRESEERIGRLVETMNEGIGVLDGGGRLNYVNDRMCDMLGQRPEELLGRHFADLVDPEGRRTTDDELAPRERRAPLRMTFLRSDGRRLPALVSPRALVDAKGEVNGSFAVITDITELIEAENAARQRQSEVAHMARVTTMGEMASTLAHELNQPLTAIVNYADGSMLRLRRAEGMDRVEITATLKRISDQAVRASGMISHIAKFVRKSGPETEPVDINRVIRRARSKNPRCAPAHLGETRRAGAGHERTMISHIAKFVRTTDADSRTERAEPVDQARQMGLAISRSIIEAYGARSWSNRK